MIWPKGDLDGSYGHEHESENDRACWVCSCPSSIGMVVKCFGRNKNRKGIDIDAGMVFSSTDGTA